MQNDKVGDFGWFDESVGEIKLFVILARLLRSTEKSMIFTGKNKKSL